MVLVQSAAALLILLSAVWATADGGPITQTALLFAAIACISEVVAVRFSPRYVVTGWDWCYLLTIFFVGGGAAILVAVSATLVGWAFARYRLPALVVNLVAVPAPIVVGSALFSALQEPLGFTPATVIATVAVMTLHILLIWTLVGLMDGESLRSTLVRLRTMTAAMLFQAAFAVVIAGVYREYGTEAVAVALIFGGVFVYMARLVVIAREQATQQANLSWGVLSGLIRTLEVRDPRAARHCAAVARFSGDIAKQAGLGVTDQRLAHTAGLLHDIGKFALSDRVLNGEHLTEDDWRGIRRHPAIGAELLRDISLYGPVGEIVGAHHERWDGRGYPNRLAGENIPVIARIVAVAEVYDTLTAPDTYRTPKTSFEALTIMREAAGTQFDPRFVDALALVLAGQDVAYRHAGDADFDRELDMERRLSEAART